MLLTSRLYGWVTLLSLRSSYQNKLRSHMYHTTIGKLPWSETLMGVAGELEGLRERFFDSCRARYDAGAELIRQSRTLPLVPLKDAFKALAETAKLVLSSEFDTGESFIVTLSDFDGDPDTHTLVLSEEGHSLTLPSAKTWRPMRGLASDWSKAKRCRRRSLLNLPIPQDGGTAMTLSKLLSALDPLAVEAQVEACVDDIDRVVGTALVFRSKKSPSYRRTCETIRS